MIEIAKKKIRIKKRKKNITDPRKIEIEAAVTRKRKNMTRMKGKSEAKKKRETPAS